MERTTMALTFIYYNILIDCNIAHQLDYWKIKL